MEKNMELTLEQLDLNPRPFEPSEEQVAIMKAGKEEKDSLLIVAMAGCAKTTSLELLARTMPVRPSLGLAFNVKTGKELEKRFNDPENPLKKFGPATHFNVKTINGLGHAAWCKALGKKCMLDDKKIGKIIGKLFKENRYPGSAEDFSSVISLVRSARHMGLVPIQAPGYRAQGLVEDSYEGWEEVADDRMIDLNDELHYYARATLIESIKQAFSGLIDFDDQIYMSALFNGVFPRYQVVFGDEVQDWSRLNHLMIARCAMDRVCLVGDPRQAIYAFRGADNSSMMNLLKLRSKWIKLKLSKTFRCPKVIVERQQTHAPGFKAAETNTLGTVSNFVNFEKPKPWRIQDVEAIAKGKSIAILCRNNAPILACALRLVRGGRGCTIIGGEIGKSLISLSRNLVPDDLSSAKDALEKISEWASKEISLARLNDKEERIGIIEDKAECLRAVITGSSAKTMGDARRVLETMFEKGNPLITLSTGHKAKGLEWNTVVHLDPFRLPSKWAVKQKAIGNTIPYEQDLNLRYVIETRTQENFIMANLKDMVA